ncbi:MAG: VWA domain-containing protein [Phototrophicaceae bacterium]|jgi:Ca-activated chloride channel family protein
MVGIQWLYPPVLGLLVLCIGFALGFFVQARQRQARIRLLGEPALIAGLLTPVSRVRRWIKHSLWLISSASLIVALARPSWGVRTDLVETQGASVMILLDVSQSMNAEDIAPSRLERAKLGIYDLLNQLGGNEVGLIVFAGTAFTVFPLTTDLSSARVFVRNVNSDAVSLQGTSIVTAVELALEAFNLEQATSKIIVLMSDGEDQAGNINETIDLAQASGVTIHVIGYGTDGGGSIPIRNSLGAVVGNKQDRTGEIVITRLEQEQLQQIAESTGGIYQTIDALNVAVQNVGQRIQQAEQGVLGTEEQSSGVERFPLFVAIALLCLTLDWLISVAQDRPLS